MFRKKNNFDKFHVCLFYNFPAEATHDYILRVVPTVYISSNNEMRYPYQYTYSYRVSSILHLLEKFMSDENL